MVHAPELIKQWQMRSIARAIKSSQEKRTKSRSKPQNVDQATLENCTPPSAPKSRSETTHSRHGQNFGNKGDTKLGRDALGSLTKPTGSDTPNLSIVNDIKREELVTSTSTTPHFHISTIIMSSSPTSNATPVPINTPDNVVTLPDETRVTSFLDLRILEANMRLETGDPTIVIQTPDYLEEQDPHPAPITEHVLQAGLARHRERLAQVAERALRLALQDDEDQHSDSDNESRTDTWELHPGWPYQERTNADNDIPATKIKGPYVAITVDNTGDPHIVTKKDCDAVAYDEGPLHAQPVELTPEEEEDHTLDPEGKEYIYGENMMLDCTFLAALGSLSDRGIAVENLCLVQLEGEE